MFELLQLLHPLLNDVLDFRLGDYQDFLLEEHDNKNFKTTTATTIMILLLQLLIMIIIVTLGRTSEIERLLVPPGGLVTFAQEVPSSVYKKHDKVPSRMPFQWAECVAVTSLHYKSIMTFCVLVPNFTHLVPFWFLKTPAPSNILRLLLLLSSKIQFMRRIGRKMEFWGDFKLISCKFFSAQPAYVTHVDPQTNLTYLLFSALFLCWGDVVAAVLSDSAQHTDTHLVRATEQLQALLMLRADLPVQVARLVHQLVPLEGGWLVMRLDVGFAVVGQAHETRLHGLVATADAEVAEGFPVHVGKRSELWKLAPGLVVHVGKVASQHRPRCESRAALWAVVYTHVVKLVPVDLDALQAEGVTARDGDRVS